MEKDLEQLKKYESWLHSALYGDYIRALWKSDMEILVPIYEKWTGKKINMNSACGKCKLDFMKKLGKLYFNNKEKMELEDGKNTERRIEDESKICSKINSRGKQPKSGNRRSNKKV